MYIWKLMTSSEEKTQVNACHKREGGKEKHTERVGREEDREVERSVNGQAQVMELRCQCAR